MAMQPAAAQDIGGWGSPDPGYGGSPWHQQWLPETAYDQPWQPAPYRAHGQSAYADGWSAGPAYVPQPPPVAGYGGFEPWTPPYPGAPHPGNIRSGGNPALGFWETAPSAFRYQRPGVAGGPEVYAHGWYTPWGDFEGVMVIRGNAYQFMGGYGQYMGGY